MLNSFQMAEIVCINNNEIIEIDTHWSHGRWLTAWMSGRCDGWVIQLYGWQLKTMTEQMIALVENSIELV